MSTALTVVLIAVAVVLVAALVWAVLAGPLSRGGGTSLRRRFGPEYDTTVARHDGDTKAAERELKERVRRHGNLRHKPLPPATRERYAAQWATLQERFVESPQQAADDADRLLARLAGERGYPADHYEEQIAALSVHHGTRIRGYRRLHARVQDGAGTEELRAAFLEARGLFDDLVAAQRVDKEAAGSASADGATSGKQVSGKQASGKKAGITRPERNARGSGKFTERAHPPWAFRKKGEAR
ncbi:hypothetical protein ACFQVC_30465 [Streptomyces monticola]|uniref:Secreted protein n=1 Tax=Streptomyces monticola TaxID=2666263 RepID=A0ABW2JT64_9ACTN